jgi:hypothetical protein
MNGFVFQYERFIKLLKTPDKSGNFFGDCKIRINFRYMVKMHIFV